jgi:hypothetical protein
MIRYSVALTELKRRIEKTKPGWLAEAAKRTQHFRDLGDYNESSSASIWGEVKEVYMELQANKCAYCESRRESADYGTIEHDVEHFRPKSSLKSWKPSAEFASHNIPLADNTASDVGYYLLPYHPFNYAISCKVCNSVFKGDRFPIGGTRNRKLADPARAAREKAYLPYPIGQTDADPEDLITFHGVSPAARMASGFDRDRALVTIEFFKLDDPKRKSLFRRRAETIVTLYLLLEGEARATSAVDRRMYRRLILSLTSDAAEHANCARSFVKLYREKTAEAREFFLRVQEYLGTISA